MWPWGANAVFEHVTLKTKLAKCFPALKETLEQGRDEDGIEVSLPGHHTWIKQAQSIPSTH
jgi:hypothetical protein